jgi:hypothetical protein
LRERAGRNASKQLAIKRRPISDDLQDDLRTRYWRNRTHNSKSWRPISILGVHLEIVHPVDGHPSLGSIACVEETIEERIEVITGRLGWRLEGKKGVRLSGGETELDEGEGLGEGSPEVGE